MLPKDFDFAMIPPGTNLKLSEIGMLSSTIESIDFAITEWLTNDLKLAATTNEGWKNVPVLWQSPERAFQIKNNKDIRDTEQYQEQTSLQREKETNRMTIESQKGQLEREKIQAQKEIADRQLHS